MNRNLFVIVGLAVLAIFLMAYKSGRLSAAVDKVSSTVAGQSVTGQQVAQQAFPGNRGVGCAGGCCSSGPKTDAQGVQIDPIDQARNIAAEYYVKKTGDKDITVQARDLGCHQEARILKDGVPVMQLSITGGNVTEIPIG